MRRFFLAVAIVSVAFARRWLVASGSILLAFFILSRTAYRHESLLVLSALAVTIWQWEESIEWERARDVLLSYWQYLFPALAVSLVFVSFVVLPRQRAFLQRYGAWRYGALERVHRH